MNERKTRGCLRTSKKRSIRASSVPAKCYARNHGNKLNTCLAPTNLSHSSIRFHCKIVSNGVKSRLRALSPVQDDGRITGRCLLDVDIVDFWLALDFIHNSARTHGDFLLFLLLLLTQRKHALLHFTRKDSDANY